MAVHRLQVGAKDVQSIHIETQVQQAAVQQYRGDQSPDLPGLDGGVDFHAEHGSHIDAVGVLGDVLNDECKDGQAKQDVSDCRLDRPDEASFCAGHPWRRIILAHRHTTRGDTRWCSAWIISIIASTVSFRLPLRLITT